MSILDEAHSRLKKVRIAAGYRTATEFCEKNNIAISTYNTHETGFRQITPKAAKKYAEILNINAAWLLTGSGIPYPNHPDESEPISEQEFFKLINYGGNPKIPFVSSESQPIQSELYCKIFEEIVRVLNDHHCSLDIKSVSLYTTEIYQDILQTSNILEEQLTMINLAMTILKRNIKLAGFDSSTSIYPD